MILIITGPPGSRKTTIARQIKKLTGCLLYDEFPISIPSEFAEWSGNLVVIVTNKSAAAYPKWIYDHHYEELHTFNT